MGVHKNLFSLNSIFLCCFTGLFIEDYVLSFHIVVALSQNFTAHSDIQT